MENKKKKFDKKAGIISGIIATLLIGCCAYYLMYNTPIVDDNILNPLDENIEEEWHTIAIWEPMLIPLGEADPGQGNSGFLACFLLDYGQNPTTLGNNATDWSASGNVHAYADTDAWSEDCPSEDPFYIVVRARFTKAVCYDEGDSQFVGNRTKCKITFSGDEAGTIIHYGNHTHGSTGGGICSENQTGGDALFVNFYFDDGSDGYRITDDGSLTVSLIELSAKY